MTAAAGDVEGVVEPGFDKRAETFTDNVRPSPVTGPSSPAGKDAVTVRQVLAQQARRWARTG